MLLILVGLGGLIWAILRTPSSTGGATVGPSREQTSPVFTLAHRTPLEAVQDFFGWRPTPVQPIAFTHKAHLTKGIRCVGCHRGVERGPEAGIPGVKVCLVCHAGIAADKPEIRKVAGYLERGEEIAWQRVYGFSPSAHVKFNHAPHIRAGIECAACHGDVAKQTVAVRAVDLTMGYCLDCHRAKRASVECHACHY